MGESASPQELFAVPDTAEPKSKSAKKAKAKKPVDPETQLKQEQAHDLAGRYYEAKRRMVSFPAVRNIIRKALDNFTYDEVFAGVKHMATVDRDRPLTLDTLRAGIERANGTGPTAGLPRLSTGDRRLVDGEWLKSAPNWDLLARLGVTPENAHLFGWRKPA